MCIRDSFCTKWIEHFPKFDPYRSETEIRYWEDYWSNIEQFKRVTNCQDYMLAYLIKDTAPKNGDLDICLDELSHVAEDGYLDIQEVGLAGIKERMQADFGPKTHLMADQARKKYENTRRKFKERPKWYFRRLERNEGLMNKIDPEHKVSSNFKAI